MDYVKTYLLLAVAKDEFKKGVLTTEEYLYVLNLCETKILNSRNRRVETFFSNSIINNP